MLNRNGQIAPDAAVFDHGKQRAPIVKLSIDENTSIEGPLLCSTGRLADFTVVASLGLGRNDVGRVGSGTGYDAYPLLSTQSDRIVARVSITDRCLSHTC